MPIFEGRMARCKVVLVYTLTVALSLATLSACGEKKIMQGTEEYRQAHGIFRGKVNEIRVREVLFRFPAEYLPEPYSSDGIHRGRADRVTLYLDLSDELNLQGGASSEYGTGVRIEIHSERYASEKEKRDEMLRGNWMTITEHPGIGLREHDRADDDGGWGYRTYESIDRVTPAGENIIYSCRGTPHAEPTVCETSYRSDSGIFIWYYFNAKLLPHWRQIQALVERRVNSLIVKQG